MVVADFTQPMTVFIAPAVRRQGAGDPSGMTATSGIQWFIYARTRGVTVRVRQARCRSRGVSQRTWGCRGPTAIRASATSGKFPVARMVEGRVENNFDLSLPHIVIQFLGRSLCETASGCHDIDQLINALQVNDDIING
jgi:hypothetical protein